MDSLPRWLPQPGLGLAKASSLEFHAGVPGSGRDPVFNHHLLPPSVCAVVGSWVEVEEPGLKLGTSYGTQASQ